MVLSLELSQCWTWLVIPLLLELPFCAEECQAVCGSPRTCLSLWGIGPTSIIAVFVFPHGCHPAFCCFGFMQSPYFSDSSGFIFFNFLILYQCCHTKQRHHYHHHQNNLFYLFSVWHLQKSWNHHRVLIYLLDCPLFSTPFEPFQLAAFLRSLIHKAYLEVFLYNLWKQGEILHMEADRRGRGFM